MSTPADLMVQAVTLQIPSGFTRNAIGEAFPTFGAPVRTTMYLEPKASDEVTAADRNTPVTDWFGVGRIDDPFAAGCRVIYGDHVFDVIGDPRPFFDPVLGVWSHQEMDLRESDDSTAVITGGVDAVATPDVVGGMGGT